ncbi:hypothetical protein Tco_0941591 [Tanacetum coccineum]|uniref:Uncharacterized protein n=1 Tax=Tanacetum coccineum TaxID=301880 RepID=A0ABQ5DRB0_9ASTR
MAHPALLLCQWESRELEAIGEISRSKDAGQRDDVEMKRKLSLLGLRSSGGALSPMIVNRRERRRGDGADGMWVSCRSGRELGTDRCNDRKRTRRAIGGVWCGHASANAGEMRRAAEMRCMIARYWTVDDARM